MLQTKFVFVLRLVAKRSSKRQSDAIPRGIPPPRATGSGAYINVNDALNLTTMQSLNLSASDHTGIFVTAQLTMCMLLVTWRCCSPASPLLRVTDLCWSSRTHPPIA